MLRRTIVFGALLVCAVGVSCNDNTTAAGTAGTVTVRAFVDVNGSGTYSAGDIPLTGTATLTGSGASSGTQVTLDSSGAATFKGVGPGTYTATITTTLPPGAVLATATTATVVVPFVGGAVESDFRYVLNPGSISGTLFKDNNGNNTYDPGTDTPAPGITVGVYAGTDTTKAPVATTTTGASGNFTFTTLRAGTYTVKVTPIPTITIVGGVTRTVTVAAGAASSLSVTFTGSLVVTIAAVRSAAVGTTAAFVGVATQNAALFASSNLYVQDSTGGILVFGSAVSGINAGDTVRVIGTTALFSGELEVEAPTGGTLSVTKTGSGPVPAAKIITTAQLIANTFAGQLVQVQGVTVRSTATTSSTAYNVNMQGDAIAADTFQVRITNTTNIPVAITSWTVGQSYNVTGVDGYFNGLPQLKVRSSADVGVHAQAMTIAAARALPANDTVTVLGVVYAGTGVYTALTAANLSLYMQDATGGTNVFNVPTGAVYSPGDSLQITGLVTFFDGEYEVARFSASSLPVIVKLGTGTTVQPRTVTAPELASRAYDGQLLRVSGLKVVSVSTPSSTGGYNVAATSPDGTALTIRVDATPVGIANTFWQVGTSYDVIGAALNFSSSGNAPFTPEIKPRSPADVTPTPTDLITIAAAKLAANLNDTLTVEGIVTAGQNPLTYNAAEAYIQDATSGVQIFNVAKSDSLKIGDAVRVHGKIVLFSSEDEFENNSTTDSLTVTKLGSGAPLAPTVITGAQSAARTFEGQLVTMDSMKVVSISTPGSSGTYTVTMTALDGTSVGVFMSSPTGSVPSPTTAGFVVGSYYNVTGLATPFGTPLVDEIKPRSAADVVKQ